MKKMKIEEKKIVHFFSMTKQPPVVFYRKGVLKNFKKFTGKYLCWNLIFNKAPILRSL